MHEPMTRVEFQSREFQICAGWVEEIRRLDAQGHFDSKRMIKRAVAEAALEELAVFLGSQEGSEDKLEAGQRLEYLVR
ncbi:MAG: hypothetical protein AB1631_33680 [Acidobacteriota bacterium]